MSNDKREVTRIRQSQVEAERIRSLHLDLSRLSNVGPYLVYQDAAFVRYLESILDDPAHQFTNLPGQENFCHLRSFGDGLFLNNIYLGSASRGKGGGRALFRESLILLAEAHHSFVELDAFISNERAVSWYTRLGFEEQSRTDWIELGAPSRVASDERLTSGLDSNGFTQLFVDGERVGTGVNRRALLLDASAFNLLGSKQYSSAAARVPTTLSDGFVAVETSVRMRAPLAIVLERLQ